MEMEFWNNLELGSRQTGSSPMLVMALAAGMHKVRKAVSVTWHLTQLRKLDLHSRESSINMHAFCLPQTTSGSLQRDNAVS